MKERNYFYVKDEGKVGIVRLPWSNYQEDLQQLVEKRGVVQCFKEIIYVDNNGNQKYSIESAFFPETCQDEYNSQVKLLQKNSEESLITLNEYLQIPYWFEIVKPKRKFDQTTIGDLKKNFTTYRKKYGSRLFIRVLPRRTFDIDYEFATHVKYTFAGICVVVVVAKEDDEYFKKTGIQRKKIEMELRTSLGCNIFELLPEETPIFISKAVNIIKDGMGKKQWRVSVLNNNIIDIARVDKKNSFVGQDIIQMAKDIVDQCQGKIPRSYQFAIIEYQDGDTSVRDINYFSYLFPVMIHKI